MQLNVCEKEELLVSCTSLPNMYNNIQCIKDLFKTRNVLPFSCTHLAWCLGR